MSYPEPTGNIIRVECPDCGVQFDTGDIGDLVGCWGCGEQFRRFENIVDKPDIDTVYRDRNLLACALVEAIGNGVMGGWTPAPDDDPDEWAIVWLETPVGQVSWHVLREMAEKLASRNDDYQYDGHSREVKNDRLASWIDNGCAY